jgi:hypothetical protein
MPGWVVTPKAARPSRRKSASPSAGLVYPRGRAVIPGPEFVRAEGANEGQHPAVAGYLVDDGAERAFLTGGILVRWPMLYHEPKTYAGARTSRKGQVHGTIQERRQRPWAAGLSR